MSGRSAGGISFAKLRDASPSERRRLIADIAERANAPVNGRLDEIKAEIAEFEASYDLPSEDLLTELYYGKRRETDEILRWLLLIRLRDRLESRRAHPASR